MLIIDGRNVNDLFYKGVQYLKMLGVRDQSRGGDVVVADSPVTSVYRHPCERVLFDPVRDANPFFHLMESLWMLAGRNDAGFLNQFVKDFGSRFAEEDGSLHGAYGMRWRHHYVDTELYSPYSEMPYIDQIKKCVEMLRSNPKERRVVISMWDPQMDLGQSKKDLPCNTHIYLRIVRGALDMMINCRSNDIIWGAYGANAVHFSVLQEVIAAGVGVPVGILYQNSWNWHAYTPILEKQCPQGDHLDPYSRPGMCALPMVDDYDSFLEECEVFCSQSETDDDWANSFFPVTAIPMMEVHRVYRAGGAKPALELTKEIGAPDWRLAAEMWLGRRVK